MELKVQIKTEKLSLNKEFLQALNRMEEPKCKLNASMNKARKFREINKSSHIPFVQNITGTTITSFHIEDTLQFKSFNQYQTNEFKSIIYTLSWKLLLCL